MVNITAENGYNTWQVLSPLPGINTHDNFKDTYKMIVVCGQDGALQEKIGENLNGFIEDDLMWFQIILLFFNILVFVAFLFFFESRLQLRVTKPIQVLTENI